MNKVMYKIYEDKDLKSQDSYKIVIHLFASIKIILKFH